MEEVEILKGEGPGAAVLEAFALADEPVPLSGGQGRSWLVGDMVLKPLDMPLAALDWHAEVLARLEGLDDVRVSLPLPTVDGAWTVQGWTAWRYQPGQHEPGRWSDIVMVGERLHAALSAEPRPAFLAQRDDVWAVADRVAWSEQPVEDAEGTEHLDRLVAARRPVPGTAQLVHGDLTGNVLFHPRLPPLVIDVSLYWRPPAFASAVIIADALVFEGAPAEVVKPMLVEPTFPQHLLRALVFRAVADRLAHPALRRGDDDPYRPAVDLAIDLVQASR